MTGETHEPGLDPEDWTAFRARAHSMLDAALDHMQAAREGPVWQPMPDSVRAGLAAPLPHAGAPGETVDAALRQLIPYGVGNTHPRFFGWVHGAGTPSDLIADMVAAAINANCGGRDHAGLAVERQVIAWMAEAFGFPAGTGGLVVSGTSMATIIALKVARDRASVGQARQGGVPPGLVGYTSGEAHSCVARAFDMLGLGSDALRLIPAGDDFRLDPDALEAALLRDLDAGRTPFALIASAGTVNTGAIDDLGAAADIAARHGLWLHVDGAFGAVARFSAQLAPRLAGIERADSLGFDFHKWMHVNYDAGCVLIRDEPAHRAAFAGVPSYLARTERGLAAATPWPVDYGPELSRGFRALRVWAHLLEHGTERIGALALRNCRQAAALGARVAAHPRLELLAPVSLNICCFRALGPGLDADALDRLNAAIVADLQESGIAAPSTTRIAGRLAIRVNLTNHRTRAQDLNVLVEAVDAAASARLAG